MNTDQDIEALTHVIEVHKPAFIHWLEVFEDSVLVLLFLTMLGLAIAQILLRNGFDSGIIWGDALIRVLVLWVGLIGAMVASRKASHINIDLVTRFIDHDKRWRVSALTSLATIIICGLLAYHSFQFVLLEHEDGLIAFANIPAWVCESIMPLAFCVISVRYTALLYLAIRYRLTHDHTAI
jgi:TRAP-type C4-dicarboxylate transport system permease small subunit